MSIALAPAVISADKWSDRLAMDVALMLEGSGETLEEVLERHETDMAQMVKYNQDTIFLQKIRALREEVHEKGLTFRVKARAQAEELLTTSWTLIHSPDVSASVKADLIKSTVKWAGLEPKEASNVEGVATGGVSITINLDPTSRPKAAISARVTEITEITEAEIVE